MEWLLVAALGVALYQLYERLRKVEARLQELEQIPATQIAPPADTVDSRAADNASAQPLRRPQISRRADDGPDASQRISAELSPEEPVVVPPQSAADSEDALEEPRITAETEEPTAAPEEQRIPLRERFDFEDIFGRRLPVWAGGAALAVAGVFLVMYSIEAGLLTPAVRAALSFGFGIFLLGAAEAAARFDHRIADKRVKQALAGAGIATLYAAFYLAGAQYELIGPAIAFAGLAATTALALALSMRFGLPTAILGLVGGFVTPLLVSSQETNIPLLAFYLALLTAGLTLTGRRLGIVWLGAGALVGGFGWGILMLLTAQMGGADQLAIGLYLLALGAVVPLLAGPDIALPYTRLVAGILASLQLAALVSLAGFDLLTWALYLLLAAALAALAWHNLRLRIATVFAAATGLVLLAVWPDPALGDFAIVCAGFGAIALLVPLAMLWRERAGETDLAQICAGTAGLAAVMCWQFGNGDNNVFQPVLAACVAINSLIAALAGLKLWRGGALARFLPAAVGIAGLLGFAALHLLLPDWAEIAGACAITLMLGELLRRRREAPLAWLAWSGAGIGLLSLLSTGDILGELGNLAGVSEAEPDLVQAIFRWTLAGLTFAMLAVLEMRKKWKWAAQALFGLLAYGLLAQIVPAAFLASICAIGVIASIWKFREIGGFYSALLAIGALWALFDLAIWAIRGMEALAGEPMLVTSLPDWRDMLRHVLPFAAATGFASQASVLSGKRGLALSGAAGIASLAIVHAVFKQLFAIDNLQGFVGTGFAERTLWQAALVGGGIALAHYASNARAQLGGVCMVGLGLAHFVVFSALLHNPVWDAQAIGSIPVANLLLPAYAIAGLAIWWLAGRGTAAGHLKMQPHFRIIRDVALMVLMTALALSLLRQGFAGTILNTTALSQSENLLRSLIGILLAIAFLFYGSRKGARSWRIGSLVLMVLAVLKVFLVDAAGLEGLLRIASFLALGFSLIGIGWVYARQLARRDT